MARNYLARSDAYAGSPDARPHIDALLRSGLQKVFPLPSEDQASNEKFRLLLEALAARGQRASHGGEHSRCEVSTGRQGAMGRGTSH